LKELFKKKNIDIKPPLLPPEKKPRKLIPGLEGS
jgi:hypothetical protein